MPFGDVAPAVAVILLLLAATLVVWATKIRPPSTICQSQVTVGVFRKLANFVIAWMKSETNVDLRFDANSINWLDEYINSHRESIKAEKREAAVAAFGSFLGESVIAVYGGKWVESGDDQWGVKTVGGITAYPFTKVRKQIDDGSFDSISSFFRAIPAIADHSSRSDSGAQRRVAVEEREPAESD